MAVSEEQVQVATCDACEAVRFGRDGSPVVGVHGTVWVVDGRGGSPPREFFACKESHAGKAARAVAAVVARARS